MPRRGLRGKMKSWLKFFGLSFFSDKIAKDGARRGMGNFFLGLILAVVFIFCGILLSNTVPFNGHYKNSAKFRALVDYMFKNYNLTLKDGLLSSDKSVDTYKDETLKIEGAEGYNLVIDTRPASAYAVFEARCVSSDGKDIPYAEYLELKEEDKKGYTFKLNYTSEELVLTDEYITELESYLSTVEKDDIKKEYEKIKSEKDDAAKGNYKDRIYALYIKAYYPDLSAYETNGAPPTVRNYYVYNYLMKYDSDWLMLFSDYMLADFTTDKGVSVNFYGFYKNMSDGALSAENADGFIKDAFDGGSALRVNVYTMNILRLVPIFIAIPLILALLVKLAFKLGKTDEDYSRFVPALKIVGSYFTFAALITAIALFVCGFFLSVDALNTLPIILFAVVMSVRTLILIIYALCTKFLCTPEQND